VKLVVHRFASSVLKLTSSSGGGAGKLLTRSAAWPAGTTECNL
jgi:hypothetical protein